MTTHNWLSFSLAIALGLVSLYQRNAKGLPVIAALLISCIGDACLANRNQHIGRFIAGIAAFSAAHILFFLYAWQFGKKYSRKTALVAGLAFGIYFAAVLLPAIDSPILCLAAALYTLLSVATLAAAIGMKSEWPHKSAFAAGIALLVFSDTLISLHEFLQWRTLSFLIIPAYLLSHLAIFLACLLEIRKNRPLENTP